MEPQGSTEAAPIVDSLQIDPVRAPAGLREWAKTLEQRARAAQRDLTQRSANQIQSIAPVSIKEAARELSAILDDGPQGVIRRVLSRPFRQLEAAAPARKGLTRRVESAIEFAATAADILAGLNVILRERDALVREFGPFFPNDLPRLIAEFRVEDSALEQIRRPKDVAYAEQRVRRLRRYLEGSMSACRAQGFDAMTWILSPNESLSPTELASRCARSLQSIARSSRHDQGRSRVIVALRQHLSAQPREPDERHTRQRQALLIEELLGRSVRSAGATRLNGLDAPLWTAALNSRVDENSRYVVGHGSLPPAGEASPVREAVPSDGSQYVTALSEGLALISPSRVTSARVWSAAVALDSAIEAQIAPDLIPSDSQLALSEIRGLFDGIGDRSSWYKIHTRARLKVIAAFPGGFVARVVNPGVIRKVDRPVVQSGSAEPNQFRIMRRPRHGKLVAKASPAIHTANKGTPIGQGYLGQLTEEARTSVAESELGWRRTAIDDREGLYQAGAAEYGLFTELHEHFGSEARSLRPLGWTKLADGGKAPVYEPLLAIAPSNSPAFTELTAHRIEWRLYTLAEIAKCVSQVHELGRVLGIVDQRMFLYRLDVGGPDLIPYPRPLLAYAPGVVKIGALHAAASRVEGESAVFPKSRLPVLIPEVAGKTKAAVIHDALAFGACALEVLLDRPLGTTTYYGDLVNIVRQEGGAFADGILAARIAAAMLEDPNRMLSLFKAMRDGVQPTSSAWLTLLAA